MFATCIHGFHPTVCILAARMLLDHGDWERVVLLSGFALVVAGEVMDRNRNSCFL